MSEERDSQRALDKPDTEEQRDRQRWVFSSRVHRERKLRKGIFAHASAQYIRAEKHASVAADVFVVALVLVLFFSCATSSPLMAQDSENRAGARTRSAPAATTQAAGDDRKLRAAFVPA